MHVWTISWARQDYTVSCGWNLLMRCSHQYLPYKHVCIQKLDIKEWKVSRNTLHFVSVFNMPLSIDPHHFPLRESQSPIYELFHCWDSLWSSLYDSLEGQRIDYLFRSDSDNFFIQRTKTNQNKQTKKHWNLYYI